MNNLSYLDKLRLLRRWRRSLAVKAWMACSLALDPQSLSSTPSPESGWNGWASVKFWAMCHSRSTHAAMEGTKHAPWKKAASSDRPQIHWTGNSGSHTSIAWPCFILSPFANIVNTELPLLHCTIQYAPFNITAPLRLAFYTARVAAPTSILLDLREARTLTFLPPPPFFFVIGVTLVLQTYMDPCTPHSLLANASPLSRTWPN